LVLLRHNRSRSPPGNLPHDRLRFLQSGHCLIDHVFQRAWRHIRRSLQQDSRNLLAHLWRVAGPPVRHKLADARHRTSDIAMQDMTDRADANGRKLIVRDVSGEVHIWLVDDATVDRPTVVLPRDGAYRLRLDLAARFIRRLLGQQVGLLPPKLRLTDFQRHHYVQLLQAAYLYGGGGEPRDVAARVLRSEQAALPAIEFKDTAARKRADRLIKESIMLVSRGYLKILRGG
jgi:hypothetical protein